MEAAATSTRPKASHDVPRHARVNQASPEVISNLIFSLSAISDQSEQLYDRLLPVHEKPPRPPSRSSRRPQANYAAGRDASNIPPVPPVRAQNQVAAAEKGKSDAGRDTNKLDTSARRLPSVAEVSSPVSPASVVASHRPKLAAHPPPVRIPDRTNSLKSQPPLTPSLMENGGNSEAFANISITPGKLNNESITSGDSGGKKFSGLGRTVSKAKSTKGKIKEMDAERKKRRNARDKKSPGLPKSSSTHRLPEPRSITPGVPLTPGFPSDEPLPSPMIGGFPAVPSGTKAASRNNIERSAEQEASDPAGSAMAAGPSDLSMVPRSRSGSVALAPGIVPPRASSSRQSIDSERRKRSRSRGAASPGPSRSGSRAQKHNDVSKAAFERDEAGTQQRIQQLQAAKEERKQKEDLMEKEKEKMLQKLQEPPRAVLGGIMPNGGVTRLEPSAASPDMKGRKRSFAEGKRPGRASALSNPASEPRSSTQIQRGYLHPVFTARSQEADGISMADSIDEAIQDYIADPRMSEKIYHPQTKRCISYSDVGDPNGSVIICCVGMGTTRFVTAFFDKFAQDLGLRLITPERPGIGESETYGPTEVGTPLGWPDDILLICRHLNIQRFSILAHSAGAVYALATALRVPQLIRGKIHILAPWIPPSQLQSIGLNEEPVPVAELPLIQRILRAIPEPLLEAATRIFNMSSITSSLGKSPYAKKKRRNTTGGGDRKRGETPALAIALEDQPNVDPRSTASSPTPQTEGLEDSPAKAKRNSDAHPSAPRLSSAMDANATKFDEAMAELTEEERLTEYETRLNAAIWNLATSNANPAVDLMVCLERKQDIGFRYEDITKQVVLHHGTKDTRVSVDNVVWIGDKMRRCEVRILEGEGHGLMASGQVMGPVLTEIAREWDEWNDLIKSRTR